MIHRSLGRLASRAPKYCAALLFLLLLVPQGAAAEPKVEAARFVEQFTAHAVVVLADRKLGAEARAAAFRELFLAGVEVDTISRFVLGRHWSEASESDRAEYRQVYETYVVRTLVQRLSPYSEETVVVGAASVLNGGDVMVTSRIEQKVGGGPLRLDWRVRETPQGWRVVDVVLEGMSLVITQRDEFASVVRGSGVPGLVTTLRERVAAL